MAGGLAVKVVPLHDSLEAFALGAADDIHELTDLENRDREVGVFRAGLAREQAKLTNEFFRRRGSLREVARLRSADSLRFLIAVTHLNRGVSVLFRALDLEHAIARRFDDGRGKKAAFLIVKARHSDLLA